jgi:hypothetical protein
MNQSVSPQNSDSASFVVYDEEDGVTRPVQAAPGLDSPSSDATVFAHPELGQIPRGMILFSRRTVYVQGILFAVVGVVAFGAGYLIGRGNASVDLLVAREQAEKHPVLLEGKLAYKSSDGTPEPDERAVAIAIPRDADLNSTLSARGLRPTDRELADTKKSIQEIEECEGAFARADAAGTYSLVLPQQGEYHLLLISAHAMRPADGAVNELDLIEMQEYFSSPDYLIGDFKYVWIPLDVGSDPVPVDHDFGTSGEDEAAYEIP